jgi:ADP-ribosyl-[dinitrogen reductase] hydrolase
MYFFAQGATVTAEQAADSARTTCQAPLVLASCRAFARALHAALSGRPKTAILAAGRSLGEPSVKSPGPAPPDTAPAVLAAALDAFDRTPNFREAVLAAANLGGSSDVVAAVCGALAGAHYSVGAIPAPWRDSLMKRHWLESYADRLLAHALLGLGA